MIDLQIKSLELDSEGNGDDGKASLRSSCKR